MKIRFIGVITLWVLAFFFGALHTILASSESEQLSQKPTPHYYENNLISFSGLVEGTEFSVIDQDKISHNRISFGTLAGTSFLKTLNDAPGLNQVRNEFLRNHRELLTTQIYPFHTHW